MELYYFTNIKDLFLFKFQLKRIFLINTEDLLILKSKLSEILINLSILPISIFNQKVKT